MDNLVLLAVCFVAAPILRKLGRLPDAMAPSLNAWVINVALPATVLVHVPRMQVDAAMLFAASMAWIVFVGAAVLLLVAHRFMHFSRETFGCLLLVAGLGNTSFLGLPMTEAFFGEDGPAVALVCDQAGSFLTLSTLGLLTVARASGTSTSAGAIVRRIVFFPPFIALVIALALRPLSPFGPLPASVLARLADTLAPIALFSVGTQLRLERLGDDLAPLLVGLGYKLLLAPALIAALAMLLGTSGFVARVTIFEAAMPPMITAGIIAADNGLRPRLANLLVGFGIIVSFATLPLVWWLTRSV